MRQVGWFKSGGEGRSRQGNLEGSTLMQKKSSNADFSENRQIPVLLFPVCPGEQLIVWGKCRITGMSVLGLGAVLLGTELPDP